jgi:hypothetical protein
LESAALETEGVTPAIGTGFLALSRGAPEPRRKSPARWTNQKLAPASAHTTASNLSVRSKRSLPNAPADDVLKTQNLYNDNNVIEAPKDYVLINSIIPNRHAKSMNKGWIVSMRRQVKMIDCLIAMT